MLAYSDARRCAEGMSCRRSRNQLVPFVVAVAACLHVAAVVVVRALVAGEGAPCEAARVCSFHSSLLKVKLLPRLIIYTLVDIAALLRPIDRS